MRPIVIIGEKINGTIPQVKEAIKNRDADFIRTLAIKQTEAGAHYLDVCAGTSPEEEVATLKWLMDIVQDAVETPLCLDSPNANVIAEVIHLAKKPGIVNSVSEEGDKCEVIFPLIQNTEWQVIGLLCDNSGIPTEVQARVDIAKAIIEKAEAHNISNDKIHIDPLVMALSADNESLLKFVATLQKVKKLYPNVKVTSGLSNISFGMPYRKVINQNFFAITIFSGMDSVILDPLDRDMMATLLATQALLGQDRHCRNYYNAYRQNKIGPKK